MRIFVIVEHYPNPYKPYIDDQLICLLNGGHEVHVFAHGGYYGGLSSRIIERQLDSLVVRYPTTLRTLAKFAAPLLGASLRSPQNALRWFRTALTHGETFKFAMTHAARLLLLPDEPPDLIIVHNLTPAVLFRFVRERYPETPYVMYYHGGEVSMQRPVRRAERGFHAPHVVLAATSYVLEEAVARGCDRSKLRINPLGFDTRLFQPELPKQYRRDGVLRIVSVGRVHDEKGIRHAIDGLRLAAQRGIDDVHYTVIGSGPLVDELEALAGRYGIGDRVHFAGVLPRERVAAALAEADVLLLPSIPIPTWQENQACVMQEAMLMHLLVSSSRTGGVQESIPGAMHRFSFDPADPVGIADAIEALHELSAEDFERLGTEGRAFAAEFYDIEAVTRDMLEAAVAAAPARSPEPASATSN